MNWFYGFDGCWDGNGRSLQKSCRCLVVKQVIFQVKEKTLKPRTKRLLVNFILEVIIYSILLSIYFLVVLRFLGEPLKDLFNQNLVVYAGATLLLIVAQSVLLDFITTFLVDRLDLEKSEH